MDLDELLEWQDQVGELFGWQDQGACRDHDTEAFFVEGRSKEAKKICSECEVESECLIFALETNSLGVWGRTTTAERQRMIEKRLGARPKNPIRIKRA